MTSSSQMFRGWSAALLYIVLLDILPTFASDTIYLSPGEMSRCELVVDKFPARAVGILVLCPGQNGDGGQMVSDPAWQKFAVDEHLDLAGISFASRDADLDPKVATGYYFARAGSGDALIQGLDQAFGDSSLPIYVYGFSGGAHFTFSFSQFHPDRVAGWCAYAANWWEAPQPDPLGPPGIIACGDLDGFNYGPTFLQFQAGRRLGKPWTWICVGNTRHQWSHPLEEFVRLYFHSLLAQPKQEGVWMDIETKNPLSATEVKERPERGAWIPYNTLTKAWIELHQP